jgi:hypothetical protein
MSFQRKKSITVYRIELKNRTISSHHKEKPTKKIAENKETHMLTPNKHMSKK